MKTRGIFGFLPPISFVVFDGMALPALNAVKKKAALEATSSDLKFLMDRESVPQDVQLALFHSGVSSVRQFAAFASDSGDLRETLKTAFGLDPAADLKTRLLVSKVVVAWEAVKARASKMAEAEGESELRREPKPLRASD